MDSTSALCVSSFFLSVSAADSTDGFSVGLIWLLFMRFGKIRH